VPNGFNGANYSVNKWSGGGIGFTIGAARGLRVSLSPCERCGFAADAPAAPAACLRARPRARTVAVHVYPWFPSRWLAAERARLCEWSFDLSSHRRL
jgi:hypothetical protein